MTEPSGESTSPQESRLPLQQTGEEIRPTPEQQEELDLFREACRKDNFTEAQEIATTFQIPEQFVHDAVYNEMRRRLPLAHYDEQILSLQKIFPLPPDLWERIGIQVIRQKLTGEGFDAARRAQKRFGVSDAVVVNSELREHFQHSLILGLQYGHFEEARKICDLFSLGTDDIRNAWKAALLGLLSERMSFMVDRILQSLKPRAAFPFPVDLFNDGEVQKAALQAVIATLKKRGAYNDALFLVETFSLSRDALSGKEVQEAAAEAFYIALRRGAIDDLVRLRNTFLLPQERVLQMATAAMSGMSEPPHKLGTALVTEQIKEIGRCLSLLPENMTEAVRMRMMNELREGHIEDVLTFQRDFHISQNMLVSPEAHEAALKGILVHLRRSSPESVAIAVRIKQICGLAPEDLRDERIRTEAQTAITDLLKNSTRDQQMAREAFSPQNRAYRKNKMSEEENAAVIVRKEFLFEEGSI